MLLISAFTIFPVTMLFGAGRHRPHHYQNYIYVYAFTSILSLISTLHIIEVLESPVSVGILNVPKGVLMTILHGGVVKGHPTASVGYYIIASVALSALVFVLQDIRGRLAMSKGSNPNGSPSSSRSMDLSTTALKALSVASFIPLLCWFLAQNYKYSLAVDSQVAQMRALTPNLKTVDVVVSYYDEPFDSLLNFTQNLRYYPWIRQRDPRFILYVKNDAIDAEELRKKIDFDSVVRLQNRGREAGTYLRHIIAHYNASVDPTLSAGYRSGLADHTLFFQGHLGWEWLAQERMWLFRDTTGYLHLAPYVKIDCGGNDIEGNGHFGRYPQIYSVFRERVCIHGFVSIRTAYIVFVGSFVQADTFCQRTLANLSSQRPGFVSRELIERFGDHVDKVRL